MAVVGALLPPMGLTAMVLFNNWYCTRYHPRWAFARTFLPLGAFLIGAASWPLFLFFIGIRTRLQFPAFVELLGKGGFETKGMNEIVLVVLGSIVAITASLMALR